MHDIIPHNYPFAELQNHSSKILLKQKEVYMSEKKFLNCIIVEGFVLLTLGLCILILPKLTALSFGVMLSVAFISYGAYKITHSIMNKKYHQCFVLALLLGIFLTVIGISLLLVPQIDLLWIIASIGIFFLLDSIMTASYAAKIRNLYSFWGGKLFSALVLFATGFVIILGLPVMSFWFVTMLSGIALLFKGMTKILIGIINKNNYSI